MRAKAARAGKRFKHAVTALFVIGYKAGQRNLYRRLASMTDVELLAALAAGNFELSLEGSTLPPVRQPTAALHQGPQRPPAAQQPGPASHHQASPLDQQRQASPLDQQPGTPGREEASQGQQDGDSQAQPGYSGQKQPKGDQPTAGTPQEQLPTAQPGATTNGRKTC
jgi:hypothetical protein